MCVGLRRILLAFVVAAVAVPSMWAQKANVVPQVAGRVVRADTGAPIAGAQVTLLPPIFPGNGQFPTEVTDSNGNYGFLSTYDGTFEIDADADGFVGSTYNPGGTLESVFQQIQVSTHLTGVDFRLVPEAVIRGLVVTADGHPAANVSVVAAHWASRVPGGAQVIRNAAQTETDADGNFVLKKLVAGSYYVVVNGPNGFVGRRNTGVWYRETWYGNKPSAEGATEVALKEGGEQSGVRITVEPQTRYKISIWPNGPGGGPMPDRYMVILEGRSHTSTGNRDGSYIIPDIPSGHYTLMTDAYSRANRLGEAETSFDITNSDVTLRVNVGRMSSVQGTVKWAAGSGTMREIIVGLAGAEDRALHRAANGFVAADGSFGFYALKPGTYTLVLNLAPPGTSLQSVRCNGVAITDDAPIVLDDKQDVTGCEVVLGPQEAN